MSMFHLSELCDIVFDKLNYVAAFSKHMVLIFACNTINAKVNNKFLLLTVPLY